MDDASLDDFRGDDGAESGTESDADPADTESDTDPADDERAADSADGASSEDDADEGDDGIAVDPETVELAASTYAWSSDPVACAACGTAVRRRFRDETGLVCADCKAW